MSWVRRVWGWVSSRHGQIVFTEMVVSGAEVDRGERTKEEGKREGEKEGRNLGDRISPYFSISLSFIIFAAARRSPEGSFSTPRVPNHPTT